MQRIGEGNVALDNSDSRPTVDGKSSIALPALTIRVGSQSFTVQAEDGPISIGREFPAQIQIADPRISRNHLRLEAHGDRWTGSDHSTNGTYHAGVREESLIVTDGMTVHLGNADGFPVHFSFDEAHARAETGYMPELTVVQDDSAEGDETDVDYDSETTDPDVARVGAAVAARRRELNISQRTLARDKIVNAGALIHFEKGRSWPHSSTRAKLEKVLKWPPGTIDRIKEDPTFTPGTHRVTDSDPTEIIVPTLQLPLMADAVELALRNIITTFENLPSTTDSSFGPRIMAVLNDLRRLEALTADVAQNMKGGPEAILLTGRVRKSYRDAMLKAAEAPNATIGQRLFAARHRAQLSIAEVASAADVSTDAVTAAEADQILRPADTEALEDLLESLDEL
ncbi:FHA domain-containing protein [Mycobacterium sp. 236(2023)]|uniref:FHA domain-containing protein n=1 Tax=Mycobacterium sp. 236(2023) TaxID=3038163 RepID=UPI0024158D8B|nr:FHA domain-containing protein [Mycobacterium sp. 236(2023)]MDG4668014.1 FHA domain-containing protein [Mycobacterium sp. 236(2023)]